MQTPPVSPLPSAKGERSGLNGTRMIVLTSLLALLALLLVFAWMTRDALQHRPSGAVRRGGAALARPGLVDESSWQTAQTLAALAVTAEESAYAQQAERLADHSVDQAFAAALREANLSVQNRKLTGEALALQQRIDELQQIVAQDQALVQQIQAQQKDLAARPRKGVEAPSSDDLEVAKAQLGLDSDQLDDATDDLARATGDERQQIQSELAAREESMKKYDSESHLGGQTAVLAVGRYGTLAGRIAAWNRQRARVNLLEQAQQQSLAHVQSLTEKHNALEQVANQAQSTANTDQGGAGRLARIQERTAQRQLLSIYDDRIQTEQRLATVYGKWVAQVEMQHRIVLHLMLQSLVWIVVILVCMVLGDALVRRMVEHPILDRRQRHTLQAILELSIQIVGVLCILLVIFGAPRETPTILGLATAALTVALQDFIIAFLGWFVLMGKKGIRVGDTVEINGVGGEVSEIGLMSTTLLETGKLDGKGYPTGRRISFLNSFAIRGQYFNFSTAGQWMLDEFEVQIPASENTHVLVEKILKAAQEETAQDASRAEQEWKKMSHRGEEGSRLSAAATVSMRPAGSEFELEIRYVTRASERLATRNRLYARVVDLLQADLVKGPR